MGRCYSLLLDIGNFAYYFRPSMTYNDGNSKSASLKYLYLDTGYLTAKVEYKLNLRCERQ